MKHRIQVFALIIFTLFLVFPQAAKSEVKILLKNGREVIADSCTDSKDRLTCRKLGGIFEIEKKDILNLKNITIIREESDESPAQGTAPKETTTGEGKTAGGEAVGSQAEDKQAPSSLTPEDKMRLDRINQRKKELLADRDKLAQDREKLNAEYKAQGAVAFPEVYDSLQKRFNEIEARINRFNAEVKKLNAEEQAILKHVQGSSESVK